MNRKGIHFPHHISCQCPFCKNKRHDKDYIPARRGVSSPHPTDCQCPFCKNKRHDADFVNAAKGKHYALAARQKMSEKRKNVPNPKISIALKGKPFSLLHRQRISKAMKNNPKITGSNSCVWKGGISFLPYPREFYEIADSIRDRDDHVCQLCGTPENGKKHPVHHIDYDKQNNSPSNLISLCVSHNTKVNRNREQWTKYFQLMSYLFEGKSQK